MYNAYLFSDNLDNKYRKILWPYIDYDNERYFTAFNLWIL